MFTAAFVTIARHGSNLNVPRVKAKAKEKTATEDEMVGWHRRYSGRGLGQIPGVGKRQGSLVCPSPWSCKELA